MFLVAPVRQVGEGEFFDRWEPDRPLARRRAFVTRALRQALQGLAFMHARQRLHQSVGPASLVLNLMDERCGTSRCLQTFCRVRHLLLARRDTPGSAGSNSPTCISSTLAVRSVSCFSSHACVVNPR